MTYTENIKDALIAKSNAEFKRLEQKGFCMSGNGFGEIVALTSVITANQGTRKTLLSTTAQDALEKALVRLGYPPHCWATVGIPCPVHTTSQSNATHAATSALQASQSSQILHKTDEELYSTIRETCAVFSAHTILLCTKEATEMMRGVYAVELAALTNINVALLAPGTLASVCGMRVLNVGDLEDAFTSTTKKQRLWSWLKHLRR